MMQAEQVLTNSTSKPRTSALWRILRRPSFVIPSVVLVLWVIAAIDPGIAPYSPSTIQEGAALAPPSVMHLFGTDQLGRDILSRIIGGSRDALVIAVGSVALGAFLSRTVWHPSTREHAKVQEKELRTGLSQGRRKTGF